MQKLNPKTKKIFETIRSGNFTVITWDNGQYSFYEGHQDVDSVNDKNLKPILEFDNEVSKGYMPDVIELLVEIIGGKVDSI